MSDILFDLIPFLLIIFIFILPVIWEIIYTKFIKEDLNNMIEICLGLFWLFCGIVLYVISNS